MEQDLGVAARLEDGARAHELVPELARVDEVAVVRHRNLAVGAIDEEGLRVVEAALAGRRVARVPDGQMAGEPLERGFVERVGDVPHRARRAHALAVGRDDAGAFLPTVLQGVQPEVGEVGRLGVPEDAEDAAFVFELVEHRSILFYAARPAKCRSIAVDQICSASATAQSIAGRPATWIVSRDPPVRPMT